MHDSCRMQKLNPPQHAVHYLFHLKNGDDRALFYKAMEVLLCDFEHKTKRFDVLVLASHIDYVKEFHDIRVSGHVLQDRNFAEQSFSIDFILKLNFLDGNISLSG
jgi:hypothetical protein